MEFSPTKKPPSGGFFVSGFTTRFFEGAHGVGDNLALNCKFA